MLRPMFSIASCFLASALILAVCFPAQAQDAAKKPADAKAPPAKEASDAAQPAATQPASGPKNEAFQKVVAEWKKHLSELRQLAEKYGAADADEQDKIRKQYGELVWKVQDMMPKLNKAGEEAYIENPKNKELETFMLANCSGNAQMDNYEEAYRLGELLLKNKCQEKNLYDWVGLSAMMIGKYDEAKKYLKVAAENKTLSKESRHYLGELESLKRSWDDEQKIRAAEAKADDLPRVSLEIVGDNGRPKGTVEIELFENEAPKAVANFISLVEKGFYDGLTFHRVLPKFMAQGGCPDGTGAGGPGYNIPCECGQPNFRRHFRGTLSMAHAGPNTGGSQFFLTFVPTSSLDGKHTAFGRVIKGMDVLGKIQKRDPEKTPPLPKPDKILKAKVLRKRDHEYVPTKSGTR